MFIYIGKIIYIDQTKRQIISVYKVEIKSALTTYYCLQALKRLLLAQNLRKNVGNEIILVTGTGLWGKKFGFYEFILLCSRFWSWSR
jgi:hypothetical protein